MGLKDLSLNTWNGSGDGSKVEQHRGIELNEAPKREGLLFGENAPVDLLSHTATPDSRQIKRILKISPDTPVGRNMKVSVGEEASPSLREITDSEMRRCYSCSDVGSTSSKWKSVGSGATRALQFGSTRLLDSTRATPKKPSKRGSKLKSNLNLGVRLYTDKKKNVVEALNDVNKEGVSNNVVENA